MADKIRWGILSTANINRALLEPIRAAERSELVAVASRDRARAQAYARENQIPRAHAGYDALLADPEVDVIYNPLPNTLHREWTIKAAQAGKHVLCEKPIVPTLPELDQVVAAAEANDVVVFEAFMYLHHPQTQRLRTVVESGELGELQMINSWFHFYLSPENSANIRLNPRLGGGGHWDVGVYPNSMAIFLNNGAAPKQVFATQQIGETGVDVLLSGQLCFAGDVVAQISSGLRQTRPNITYVVGETGTALVETPWKPDLDGPGRIVISRRGGEVEVIDIEPVNPYLCEVQAMEACLLDRAKPVVSLDLSRNFLRSTLALYESARTGQAVTL